MSLHVYAVNRTTRTRVQHEASTRRRTGAYTGSSCSQLGSTET